MRLRRVLALAVTALLAAHASAAAADGPDPITFGGENYSIAHKEAREDGNSLVELVREGDKIATWQKLVAFHRFPGFPASPKDAALGLAMLLRERDPAVQFTIVENPRTLEVIIDFLAAEKNSDNVEFNVFKYARHESRRGLIALQFAARFKRSEVDGERMKGVREAAIDEAARFDLTMVDAYLAPKSDDDIDPEIPKR